MRSIRTRVLAAAVAISIMPLGAACGGADDAAVSGASRTVEDVSGAEVEVPAEPERVVALSEPALDGLLALGITPVGAVTGRGQGALPSYLADRTAGIPVLGSVAQPNFQEIGKADPDLILVDGTSLAPDAEALGMLRKIAPVVYTGYAGGDWSANFALVADAVNRADEGAEVVRDYRDRAADVAGRLAPSYDGKTFSIVRWQGGSGSLILKDLPPGQALADLGLARPKNQDRFGRGHSEPVSLENLAEIDADYLFFGTLGGSSVDNPEAGGSADLAGAEKALAEAEQAPGFTDLTAYRSGHVILVDGSLWTSTGGPLLMSRIVDAVEESLL